MTNVVTLYHGFPDHHDFAPTVSFEEVETYGLEPYTNDIIFEEDAQESIETRHPGKRKVIVLSSNLRDVIKIPSVDYLAIVKVEKSKLKISYREFAAILFAAFHHKGREFMYGAGQNLFDFRPSLLREVKHFFLQNASEQEKLLISMFDIAYSFRLFYDRITLPERLQMELLEYCETFEIDFAIKPESILKVYSW